MMRIRLFSAVVAGIFSGLRLLSDRRKTQRAIDAIARLFIHEKTREGELSVWGGGREGDGGDERVGRRVVTRREFAAMRFDDRAGAIEPEAVMALAERTERFPAPVLSRAREVFLRL